jgi:hypothetical protein
MLRGGAQFGSLKWVKFGLEWGCLSRKSGDWLVVRYVDILEQLFNVSQLFDSEHDLLLEELQLKQNLLRWRGGYRHPYLGLGSRSSITRDCRTNKTQDWFAGDESHDYLTFRQKVMQECILDRFETWEQV